MTDTIKIQSYHNVQVNCDTLDDDRTVVNFDLYDTEQDEIVAQSGYVQIEQGNAENFILTVFNSDGDVSYTVALPFNFKE